MRFVLSSSGMRTKLYHRLAGSRHVHVPRVSGLWVGSYLQKLGEARRTQETAAAELLKPRRTEADGRHCGYLRRQRMHEVKRNPQAAKERFRAGRMRFRMPTAGSGVTLSLRVLGPGKSKERRVAAGNTELTSLCSPCRQVLPIFRGGDGCFTPPDAGL